MICLVAFVCPFVCLYVYALLFELFDLDCRSRSWVEGQVQTVILHCAYRRVVDIRAQLAECSKIIIAHGIQSKISVCLSVIGEFAIKSCMQRSRTYFIIILLYNSYVNPKILCKLVYANELLIGKPSGGGQIHQGSNPNSVKPSNSKVNPPFQKRLKSKSTSFKNDQF